MCWRDSKPAGLKRIWVIAVLVDGMPRNIKADAPPDSTIASPVDFRAFPSPIDQKLKSSIA